ncbi:MAG: hypothetical protein ACOCT9_00400 [archaeon]
MEIINILAQDLSRSINISAIASRGLLKLAIKDELGPFIPFRGLLYQDLKKVINNSLKERLEKLNIEGQQIEKIRMQLNSILSKNQSLITMEKT